MNRILWIWRLIAFFLFVPLVLIILYMFALLMAVIRFALYFEWEYTEARIAFNLPPVKKCLQNLCEEIKEMWNE